MKIRFIRNATMKISYAGQTILTDPMFSAKGAFMSFAGIQRNPTVDLTVSIDEIIDGVNAVLVSHIHPDHFDEAAVENLPPAFPIFCQPGDEKAIAVKGLKSVQVIGESIEWRGITITRTEGKHGSGQTLDLMGKVSGFILRVPGKPVVYWAGDTILCDDVRENIEKYRPDIVILHSGGAGTETYGTIIMDADQTIETAKLVLSHSPDARIIAIHMESLDHCAVKRETLRTLADQAGIAASSLLIPADGEELNLN
ncbi:MAG: MBL fold metallo-hydrolase [Candidatus Wallbacteria bacterium HGW-Wallbacteria-1]|uniref:MBL fold metallo-hydrolase n=1 Tax=Candidatus Wallbacteria bacterium HGW-Wallbacteria-1 TaxID=2013854 RepID=A0A2N1PJ95_9BACT|nr:MAG: MBL fold metallo-hydrolase [Candidatus Wallbacteria bacterium HGW-Wallbacteria-1]